VGVTYRTMFQEAFKFESNSSSHL